MTSTRKALLLAAALLAIAVLAVFDIVPAEVAQYTPLAVVPFIVRRRTACAGEAC